MSKWMFHRQGWKTELVELIIDGQKIDLGRVIIGPGSFEFSLLEDGPSSAPTTPTGQIDLFAKGEGV